MKNASARRYAAEPGQDVLAEHLLDSALHAGFNTGSRACRGNKRVSLARRAKVVRASFRVVD